MATMYQKKTAIKRRTSDIERLAKQYQQQIGQLTTEYETQYGQYQAESQTKMADYEKQAAAYNQAFGEYQANVLTPYQEKFSAYNTALENYNQRIKDLEAGKFNVDLQSRYVSGQGYFYNLPGYGDVSTEAFAKNPKAYGYEFAGASPRGYGVSYRPTAGAAPEAPTAPEAFAQQAPTAPELGAFDTAQFDEKRGQLEQTFKREVSERRAGRLAAVSRKSSRPLLKGA